MTIRTSKILLKRVSNDFVCLPIGSSFREAKVKVIKIGPLHKFLGKGFK
jgi:hypothetical protein